VKAVVGQEEAIRLCALALVTQGTSSSKACPDRKTLLAKSIARALALDYAGVPVHPRLMPADIVGTAIYDLGQTVPHAAQGPYLHERAACRRDQPRPAKVQSALLEAMEERGCHPRG